MKIKKRQNTFYSFFNGKNRISTFFFIMWDIYFLMLLIFFKHNLPLTFGVSLECKFFIVLLSVLLIMTIILFRLSQKLYFPRFNPNTFYKYKVKKTSENTAIIATKKYIDLHYSRMYDADDLLPRLKKLESDNEIFSQLPSNIIVGIVTGLLSGIMLNNLFFCQDDNIMLSALKSILFIVLFVIISLAAILFVFFSIKSFYCDYTYNSTIVPYEINKIKQQLIKIDDIYSYIKL